MQNDYFVAVTDWISRISLYRFHRGSRQELQRYTWRRGVIALLPRRGRHASCDLQLFNILLF